MGASMVHDRLRWLGIGSSLSVVRASGKDSMIHAKKIHLHPLMVVNETNNTNDEDSTRYEQKTSMTWRFLEVLTLSAGHYFGFESCTEHGWYLGRSLVDLISS